MNCLTLDQSFSVGNILVSLIGVVATIYIAYLANKLSAKTKYDHEIYISDQLHGIKQGKIILADVKKYNSDNDDATNETYYKQACGFGYVIPVYGVVVYLRDSDGDEPGLIPFDWIEYVRPYDSEDSVAIVICKFKGIKWYKNFKSPIKKILDKKYLRKA